MKEMLFSTTERNLYRQTADRQQTCQAVGGQPSVVVFLNNAEF